MKQIFFSVVIPLYNKERSVFNTIKSVINQTYDKFEIIIVNDGSTDNSLRIVNSFDDKRLKIINKLNGGVSSARNVGIAAAKHEWLTFIDSDDIWSHTFLEKMQKLIFDFPEAKFFGSWFGHKIKDEVVIVNGVHKTRGYINDFFKETKNAPLVNSSCIVVNRNCFNQIGVFDTELNRGEDLILWIKLGASFKIAFEPELLSYYVLDSDNRACLSSISTDQTLLFFSKLNITSSKGSERKYYRYLFLKKCYKTIISKDFHTLGLLLKKYFANLF